MRAIVFLFVMCSGVVQAMIQQPVPPFQTDDRIFNKSSPHTFEVANGGAVEDASPKMATDALLNQGLSSPKDQAVSGQTAVTEVAPGMGERWMELIFDSDTVDPKIVAAFVAVLLVLGLFGLWWYLRPLLPPEVRQRHF